MVRARRRRGRARREPRARPRRGDAVRARERRASSTSRSSTSCWTTCPTAPTSPMPAAGGSRRYRSAASEERTLDGPHRGADGEPRRAAAGNDDRALGGVRRARRRHRGLLAPGGMLLLHDYGFARAARRRSRRTTAAPARSAVREDGVPGRGRGGFPRSFFRVFGNEARRVVQVTNDVNFAELAAALEPGGRVATIPHGSQILNAGREPAKGPGRRS